MSDGDPNGCWCALNSQKNRDYPEYSFAEISQNTSRRLEIWGDLLSLKL